MSLEYYILFSAGAAAGGFINGLAGFGTALFALGFWLQIMPPVSAVSTIVIMSVASGLQGAWIVRTAIFDHPKRLLRFLLPGLLGIPLGIAILSVLDAHYLKIAIAGIMVLYGGFFSWRKSLPNFDHPTPITDSFIGLLGGVLGGAASLSGVLPTIWCSLRTWPKSETRAVLQPFNIAILSVTAIIFLLNGNYTWVVIKQIAFALPITLIFSQIGLCLFKHLKDDQFRRLLITIMLAAGLILLAKELVGA